MDKISHGSKWAIEWVVADSELSASESIRLSVFRHLVMESVYLMVIIVCFVLVLILVFPHIGIPQTLSTLILGAFGGRSRDPTVFSTPRGCGVMCVCVRERGRGRERVWVHVRECV